MGSRVTWGICDQGISKVALVLNFDNVLGAIESFACKETEKIWSGQRSRRLPEDIRERSFLKLRQLHQAGELADMRVPPSNRLEALSGNLKGFWSVRINQQWRLVFRWNDGMASEVRISDYH